MRTSREICPTSRGVCSTTTSWKTPEGPCPGTDRGPELGPRRPRYAVVTQASPCPARCRRGVDVMRIYISADMEGVTGVTHSQDVISGRSQYERFRALLTADVNAAI